MTIEAAVSHRWSDYLPFTIALTNHYDFNLFPSRLAAKHIR